METNKDLILRNIKYFSEFLMALTKQKTVEIEEIDFCINEFVLKHFRLTLKSILEREPNDILKIIEADNNSIENIKDFTNVLFIKHSLEKDSLEKKELSEKIVMLYQIYQGKSSSYSFETQLRINGLKALP